MRSRTPSRPTDSGPSTSLNRGIGLGMMVLAMVLVGSTVVASDIIGEGMSPFQGTALRFAIAGTGFAALWILRNERLPQLARRDWLVLFLQATAGSFAYSILLIVGLYFTAGSNAGVVIGTLPAMIAVLAFLVFGERLGGARITAISLATLSVLIVTLAPNANQQGIESSRLASRMVETEWRVVVGTLIILLAVFCEAAFLTLNRTLRTPVPAFQVAALMCGFGVVLSGLGAFIEWIVATPPVPSVSALWGAVYYAVVPTLIGFPLWYGGAARGTTSDAALATAVMPVAAVGLSALILGEAVSQLQMGGCGLVVLAILFGTFGDRDA